jgi:hypothetical protein
VDKGDATPGHDDDHPRVEPNRVSVVGLIEDPHDPFLHGPGVVTGINAEVAYGRSTTFDGELDADGHLILGRVITVDDGAGVPGGSVILMGTSDGRDSFYETTKIEADGRFRGNTHEKAVSVQAHFVPPTGYGECVSKERRLDH